MHPAPQVPDQVRSRKGWRAPDLSWATSTCSSATRRSPRWHPNGARDSTRRYELELPMAIAIDDRTAEIVGTAENGGESSMRTNPWIPLTSEIV